MTFPTNLSNYTGSETLLVAEHAQEHNALEAKVGIDGSAVTTSHDYKLSGVTGTDKAVSKTGIETLTNKTLTSPVINTPTGDVATITGAQTLKNKIINTKSSDGNVFKLNNNTLISPSDEDGEYIFPTANATLVGTSETQTLSNKTLTSPVINTSFSGTAKATASEVATGTDDTKIVTPLSAAAYGNSSMARQAIINGNFTVWQRGVSLTFSQITGMIADRWLGSCGDVYGSLTISQQSFTIGQTDVPNNPKYFLRFAEGAEPGVAPYITQRIEGVEKFANGKATLSVWLKVASGTLVVTPKFVQSFGTGGSPSADVITTNATWTVTTTWTKFTTTFTVPSVSGKTLGSTVNTDYCAIKLDFPAGGAFTIDIAQVQLCAGDVALPFQPKSYAQELADCQRYAFKAGSDTSGYSSIASGICTATTSASALIVFPVRMRTAPTSTYPTANTLGVIAAAGTVVALTVIADDVLTEYSARVTCTTASGLTAGNATNLIKNNSTSTILFSAEL